MKKVFKCWLTFHYISNNQIPRDLKTNIKSCSQQRITNHNEPLGLGGVTNLISCANNTELILLWEFNGFQCININYYLLYLLAVNVNQTMGNMWDPRLSWLYPYMSKSPQKRKGGQIRFIFYYNLARNDISNYKCHVSFRCSHNDTIRFRFTNEQTDALEHKFDSHKYLSPQERKKLAKSLSLSERQVISMFSLEVRERAGMGQ